MPHLEQATHGESQRWDASEFQSSPSSSVGDPAMLRLEMPRQHSLTRLSSQAYVPGLENQRWHYLRSKGRRLAAIRSKQTERLQLGV